MPSLPCALWTWRGDALGPGGVSGAPFYLPLLVLCLDPLKSNSASSWSLGSPESPSLSLTYVSLGQSGSGILMGQESEKIKYNWLLVGDKKGKLKISLLVLFRPLNAFDPNMAEGPAKAGGS